MTIQARIPEGTAPGRPRPRANTTSGERARAMRQAALIFLGEFPGLRSEELRRDYPDSPVIREIAEAMGALIAEGFHADAFAAGMRATVSTLHPRDGAR